MDLDINKLLSNKKKLSFAFTSFIIIHNGFTSFFLSSNLNYLLGSDRFFANNWGLAISALIESKLFNLICLRHYR